MKLLICDYKKMHTYQIPKTTEDFYTISFKYSTDNQTFREVLSLKFANNQCSIVADEKLSILMNNNFCNEVILEENLFFYLKFADMADFFPVYVIPDFSEFVPYQLNGDENLAIGSTQDCNIKYVSPNAEQVVLFRNGPVAFLQRTNMQINATYCNAVSYDITRVDIGDFIFVNGIFIIYMKDYILINEAIKNNLELYRLQLMNFESDNSYNEITPVTDVEKNVKLYNDDQLFVHTPRLKFDIESQEVVVDPPPEKQESQKVPAIFTLGSSSVMLVTSGVSLLGTLKNLASGQTEFFSALVEVIAFGAMFITSLFLPFLMQQWERFMDRKREKLRQKKYKEYIKGKIEEINGIIKRQEEIIKLNNPSLEQIEKNILNTSSEIWSREIADNDFLLVSLGVGNVKSQIQIQAPREQFSLIDDNLKDLIKDVTTSNLDLKNVPITFSIPENVVLPIVVGLTKADDYIMSIMLQLLYYHSGNDLKIVIITNEYNEKKWEFMKCLPHNWDKNYEKRYFASREEELSQIALYLEQEYDARLNKMNNNSHQDVTKAKYADFSEYYLIVTDDYKMAREMPIIDKILNSEDKLGFSIVIFEKSIKNLPSKFSSLVNVRNEGSYLIKKDTSSNGQQAFEVKFIENLDITKYAHILANIPINIKSADSGIPSNLTFLDMFQAGRVDQLNILSRWLNNNPTVSLKTTVGFKEDDRPIELDLHEKAHGPHGLIAGSTGSGKSEFIITYILSMAVNYHPYEVQFVLIDYKGGGLAGAFENKETGVKLPHLIGTITNLDKNEMNRTLVSIKSELQRRQRVFNETRDALGEGTIDIYKYQRLYRDGRVAAPMSHLFIISDEFAELKAQQPDFMEELVSTARIGRSLGVHLILATQKPAGVVDEQIWSNTRFRVCLKVQTTEDSMELLKRNDAAFIRESGRFYLQVGNDEIFELGQSGWAGAKYVPTDNIQRKVDDSISFLANNGDVIKNINEEVKKEELEEQGEQLTNIVKYLYDIANRENIKASKLWLDNIPEVIYYEDLIKKYNLKAQPYFIDPIIGEYDDPANQRQSYVDLPLSTCGNTFIVGISGSGKSTLLTAIMYSTIVNHNVNEVNIYVVDLGAEKLKAFQKAPQVGDVLTASDPEKIKFLFYMLQDEKNKRFSYYSKVGGSFDSDIEAQRCPFPTILVIINDIDVFKEMFEDLYDYDVVPFTRNCAKVGIILIVTSTVASSLGYMAENNFPKKIMLNMLDSSDYTTYFDKAITPKKNAGRGIIMMDEVYEFQTPLIFEENLFNQKLNYILSLLDKNLGTRAKPVPVIPDEVTINMLADKIKTLSALPLGVNMKTAQLASYNFDRLLTIVTAKNYVTAKGFFPRLMEIITYLKNYKIMVVNSIKDLHFAFPETVKYYDSNFKKIVSVINDNVNKCKETARTDNFVIVFIGYAALQSHLVKAKEEEEDETIVNIDELISNSKTVSNFKYILFDVDSRINRISEGSLDTLFKRNSGIWLGKEFEDQETFDCNDTYNVPSLTNSNIVIVENGKAEFVKYN